MPLSSYRKLSLVMNFVFGLGPRRVLDVGCGWGTYGWLCRQYLDPAFSGAGGEDTPRPEIIGVEVFERYRNPIWELAYDDVVIGDAVDVVPTLGSFDLVLLCDVIEHLSKDAGLRLLDALLSRSPCVLVSSPLGEMEQDALFDNEAERHLSAWTRRDFAAYHTVYRECPLGFVVLVSRDPVRKGVAASTHPWALAKLAVRATLPKPLVGALRALLWPFRRLRRIATGGCRTRPEAPADADG